jgi:hypothetical protein
MIWIYKLIPLVVALTSLYSFLRAAGIIVYADDQQQKDYEEYVGKGGMRAAIVSFVSFVLFMIMFIRGLL